MKPMVDFEELWSSISRQLSKKQRIQVRGVETSDLRAFDAMLFASLPDSVRIMFTNNLLKNESWAADWVYCFRCDSWEKCGQVSKQELCDAYPNWARFRAGKLTRQTFAERLSSKGTHSALAISLFFAFDQLTNPRTKKKALVLSEDRAVLEVCQRCSAIEVVPTRPADAVSLLMAGGDRVLIGDETQIEALRAIKKAHVRLTVVCVAKYRVDPCVNFVETEGQLEDALRFNA